MNQTSTQFSARGTETGHMSYSDTITCGDTIASRHCEALCTNQHRQSVCTQTQPGLHSRHEQRSRTLANFGT